LLAVRLFGSPIWIGIACAALIVVLYMGSRIFWLIKNPDWFPLGMEGLPPEQVLLSEFFLHLVCLFAWVTTMLAFSRIQN
jgi:hypothetical protein